MPNRDLPSLFYLSIHFGLGWFLVITTDGLQFENNRRDEAKDNCDGKKSGGGDFESVHG